MQISNNKFKIAHSLTICIFAYLLIAPFALGATPSPQPSKNQISSDSADLEKIQKIKDIVANKVSKLKLVEKRGIIGTVKEISNSTISITDIKDQIRRIDVDELTKFDIDATGKSGISDLKKGKKYSFVGLYNKDTQKLLARSVSTTDTIPFYFEGAVKSLNSKKYQITLVNEKGDEKIIDIQSSTKTSLATNDGDLIRSGFSKIEVNERVLAIGFWDKKDNDLLLTTRVIHFKDIPPSKEMQSHVEK